MKNIEWNTSTDECYNIIPFPNSSKKYIPEWYKKIPKFKNNNKVLIQLNELNSFAKYNLTVKSCVPFLDAFTLGYIQETWCDIYIQKEMLKDKEILKYNFSMDRFPIMSHRDEVSDKNLIKNKDFYEIEFIWKQFWFPKLPKGYSLLMTHPLNRTDLPFFTMSGVIDCDTFVTESKSSGNHPFFIKNNFEGLIPAGTPMFQVIPIKREKWTSKKTNKKYFLKSPRKYFYDGYKKMYWQKKEYD
jgi:hypothetical protein